MSQLKHLEQLQSLLKDTGLCGIKRGIEREALRITPQGALATDPHPAELGSALTHPLITTDYSESLLEFITPVSENVATLLSRLADIHHFSVKHIGEQRLWPLSMPCYVGDPDDINLADYGQSNIGKMKRAYREGLKRRYGSPMQIISGVHYNFSLPMHFWEMKQKLDGDSQPLQDYISEQYMALIRNFYRYGWMVAYLYGASPAVCGSFVDGKGSKLPFETLGQGTRYLPFATSLRLSDLGYTSNEQNHLEINYNSVAEYVSSVQAAVNRHSEHFEELGVKVDGEYRQLNANVLQIENELYAPIRAKRVAKSGQTPSQALSQGGVEYIEIRALDVNPFSPLGVTEQQVRVIDSLLLACLLLPSAPMGQLELQNCRYNFNQVAVRGRDPQLNLAINGEDAPIGQYIEQLLAKMEQAAELLDTCRLEADFGSALAEARREAEQGHTYSARVMDTLLSQDLDNSRWGLELAQQYREQLLDHQGRNWQYSDFAQMTQHSFSQQSEIERNDTLSFDAFLEQYFINANQ